MGTSVHTMAQAPNRGRSGSTARRRRASRSRRFDLLCSTCGYGVVVSIAPERCPMCGGSTWAHPARNLALRLGLESPPEAA
jgi:rubrerythrin